MKSRFTYQNNQEESDNDFWISYTDLITGFLIIFILITLILKVQLDKTMPIEQKKQLIVQDLKEKLDSKCNLQITDEATVRFFVQDVSQSPLFDVGKDQITPTLKGMLDCFIPSYIALIEKEYNEELTNNSEVYIKEIRIEGHTDRTGSYVDNLDLSSRRANQVFKYIYESETLKNWTTDEQKLQNLTEFIRQRTIAVGYSFSKVLNAKGEIISLQNNTPEDPNRSRRVEFRIILDTK